MTTDTILYETVEEINATLDSMLSLNNDSNRKPPEDAFGALVKGLELYIVPCIVLIGFVGNITSFLIFTKTFLRFNSSSVYLSALAFSDTGFLLCIFVLWLHQLGINLTGHQGACQIFMYLIYLWSFLSVWYVVAFTTERFIAVCFPLKRNVVCSVKRAKIVVVSIATFAALYYSYALWTSGITYNNGVAYCWPKVEYVEAVSVLNYIDTLFTLLLPVILLIVFNLKIIVVVSQIQREQHKMRHPASNGFHRPVRVTRTNAKTNRPVHPQNSCQMKVTKMLIIVSVTFLLLNLPNHTVRIYLDICRLVKTQYRAPKGVLNAQMLFQYIYYINFCINIFLYAMFGSNFRKAAKTLYGNCRSKVNPVFRFCCKDSQHQGYTKRSPTNSNSPTKQAVSCKTSVMSLSQAPGRYIKDNIAQCEGTMV